VHARQFAKELLDLRSDVILANSTPIAVAVRDITRTTPTVFVQVSDPITAGVVLRLIERDAVITIIDARDHVGRILGGLGSQGPDCVAEDAANIEPVSTGQIPVYQGKEPGIL
jgi:hypothetical protein